MRICLCIVVCVAAMLESRLVIGLPAGVNAPHDPQAANTTQAIEADKSTVTQATGFPNTVTQITNASPSRNTPTKTTLVPSSAPTIITPGTTPTQATLVPPSAPTIITPSTTPTQATLVPPSAPTIITPSTTPTQATLVPPSAQTIVTQSTTPTQATLVPKSTAAHSGGSGSSFDVGSFFGGMALVVCLVIIAAVGYACYIRRTNSGYNAM